MLVLTRKPGESICIGDEVEIRVVSAHGPKVRIAIDAPAHVLIRRKELLGPQGCAAVRLVGAEAAARTTREIAPRRKAVG